MKRFRVVAIELLAFALVALAVTQTAQGQAAAVRVPAEPKGSPQIEKMLQAFEGRGRSKKSLRRMLVRRMARRARDRSCGARGREGFR